MHIGDSKKVAIIAALGDATVSSYMDKQGQKLRGDLKGTGVEVERACQHS